jgi:glycosyltransferase involved in cell wall biosynthesis
MAPMGSVCFIAWEASLGGVEKQIHILSKEAYQKGYDVSIVLLGQKGPACTWWEETPVHMHVLNCAHQNDVHLFYTLRQFFTQHRYDMVYISSTVKIPIVSCAVKHGLQCIHVGNPFQMSLKQKTGFTLRRWFFHIPHHVVWIPCSQHVLASMQQHSFFKKQRLMQSYNCIDIPNVVHTPNKSTPGFNIGMVARLDRIKDHATLIQAMFLIKQRGWDVVCHMLGSGSLLTTYQQQTQDLGLEKHVVWHGACSDISQHLRSWDAYVFSTTPQEGLGSAMAEAMAYGLACVFSDLPPCHEVGGDCVWYAKAQNPQDFADKIISLLQNSEQRKELGTKARVRAKKYFSAERGFNDLFLAHNMASRSVKQRIPLHA